MNKTNKKILRKIIIIILTLIALVSFGSDTVQAKTTKSVSRTYTDNTGRNQWRFVFVYCNEKWTPSKAITGQPVKGIYCKKGDGLFWYDNGKGTFCTLSFNIGGKYGTVGISVPLGCVSSNGYGQFCAAPKNGYYKIYVRKNIKPTIIYIQRRSYRYNYPYGYKWTKWSTSVYKTKYIVVQARPTIKMVAK